MNQYCTSAHAISHVLRGPCQGQSSGTPKAVDEEMTDWVLLSRIWPKSESHLGLGRKQEDCLRAPYIVQSSIHDDCEFPLSPALTMSSGWDATYLSLFETLTHHWQMVCLSSVYAMQRRPGLTGAMFDSLCTGTCMTELTQGIGILPWTTRTTLSSLSSCWSSNSIAIRQVVRKDCAKRGQAGGGRFCGLYTAYL